MQVSDLKVDADFKMTMLDCVYEDIRVFALNTKVDDTAEDFDLDEHMEDYLFYRGVMSHDARTNEVQTYMFSEPNVFRISEGRHVGAFFYLTCSEDGRVTHGYRRDFMNGKSEYVVSWDRSEVQQEMDSYPGSWIDTLAVSRFYTLDEYHALVAFHLTGERSLRFALMDVVQKTWTEIELPAFFNGMESMTNYSVYDQTWVFIKIGESMPHERQQIWMTGGEQMPEQCMIIKMDRLIEMLKQGERNFAEYIFFSSQPHQALLDMVWRDGKAELLIRDFLTGSSVMVKYDCQHGKTIQHGLDDAYDRLYVSDHSLYAVQEEEGKTKLVQLDDHTERQLHTGSRRIIAIVDEGVLTTDMTMLAEDEAIYIHKYDQPEAKVLVHAPCFVDNERQLILACKL